ncbi:family 1 glycosylhydrolase [Nakamurella lactea]|uniref:family 1 glycosylhydrolase n=1 Tax=Nakamurella lactea TaxID=459515 RepID=UPI000491C816|nr:family 1 glycosylhydrolase [Nakamurella lactea]
MTTKVFPGDFIWSVATSAYQIGKAPTMATVAGPSISDTLCRRPARRTTGTTAKSGAITTTDGTSTEIVGAPGVQWTADGVSPRRRLRCHDGRR